MERAGDAQALSSAAHAAGIEEAMPLLDEDQAALQLGFSLRSSITDTAIAAQVTKAERLLGQITRQLASVVPQPAIRSALGLIQQNILRRRDDVRHLKSWVAYDSPPLGMRAPPEPEEAIEGAQVEVWFATNRAYAKARFGSERSNTSTFGKCDVFVPTSRLVGSTGNKIWERLFRPKEKIVLTATKILSEPFFWHELRKDVLSLPAEDRQALVYIHGFNTKFDQAAIQAAQLKVDLKHLGPVAFFSWPTLGNVAGYSVDAAASDYSEGALRNFLYDFASRSDVSAVHIIAHSMGNRALLRVIDSLVRGENLRKISFGQIILAAPDIDTGLFSQLSSAYAEISVRSTIYVSNNDRAIGLSAMTYNYPRVGLTPPVTIAPGIDTVDVSDVNLGFWGHGYAREVKSVMADISELLRDGTPPERRFGVRRVAVGSAHHWALIR